MSLIPLLSFDCMSIGVGVWTVYSNMSDVVGWSVILWKYTYIFKYICTAFLPYRHGKFISCITGSNHNRRYLYLLLLYIYINFIYLKKITVSNVMLVNNKQ